MPERCAELLGEQRDEPHGAASLAEARAPSVHQGLGAQDQRQGERQVEQVPSE